ncbi:hypothetical protein [Nocardioides sp. GY 10113]|uniref:hypothetical protein n=1 Tax=Nocardioides sp. GY 10113 TaxID=2569761 RepID=UPI0010A9016E|nr:hypothetical protein [Nocardioides sp. GY 10113]
MPRFDRTLILVVYSVLAASPLYAVGANQGLQCSAEDWQNCRTISGIGIAMVSIALFAGGALFMRSKLTRRSIIRDRWARLQIVCIALPLAGFTATAAAFAQQAGDLSRGPLTLSFIGIACCGLLAADVSSPKQGGTPILAAAIFLPAASAIWTSHGSWGHREVASGHLYVGYLLAGIVAALLGSPLATDGAVGLLEQQSRHIHGFIRSLPRRISLRSVAIAIAICKLAGYLVFSADSHLITSPLAPTLATATVVLTWVLLASGQSSNISASRVSRSRSRLFAYPQTAIAFVIALAALAYLASRSIAYEANRSRIDFGIELNLALAFLLAPMVTTSILSIYTSRFRKTLTLATIAGATWASFKWSILPYAAIYGMDFHLDPLWAVISGRGAYLWLFGCCALIWAGTLLIRILFNLWAASTGAGPVLFTSAHWTTIYRSRLLWAAWAGIMYVCILTADESDFLASAPDPADVDLVTTAAFLILSGLAGQQLSNRVLMAVVTWMILMPAMAFAPLIAGWVPAGVPFFSVLVAPAILMLTTGAKELVGDPHGPATFLSEVGLSGMTVPIWSITASFGFGVSTVSDMLSPLVETPNGDIVENLLLLIGLPAVTAFSTASRHGYRIPEQSFLYRTEAWDALIPEKGWPDTGEGISYEQRGLIYGIALAERSLAAVQTNAPHVDPEMRASLDALWSHADGTHPLSLESANSLLESCNQRVEQLRDNERQPWPGWGDPFADHWLASLALSWSAAVVVGIEEDDACLSELSSMERQRLAAIEATDGATGDHTERAFDEAMFRALLAVRSLNIAGVMTAATNYSLAISKGQLDLLKHENAELELRGELAVLGSPASLYHVLDMMKTVEDLRTGATA